MNELMQVAGKGHPQTKVSNRQVLNHKVNILNPGLDYKIFKGE